MKRFIACAAIILTFMATGAYAQDDIDRRLELAKKYSSVVPVSTDIAGAIDEMVIQVPVEQRPLFRSILIKADRVETASELALAETFTAGELEKLVEFYSTPEGKSIKQKMMKYQDRLQPILQSMIEDAARSFASQSR